MKIAVAVSALAAFLALAILGSYALGLHAINASQRKWCTTLTLLTSRPVPRPAKPRANPSREDAWLFYMHLKELEREFGCG